MKITKALFKGLSLATIASLTLTQCAPSSSDNKKGAEFPHATYEFQAKDTTWKNLTVREKIGQTMMVVSKYFDYKEVGNGDIKAFMEKYPVGGIFIARWYYVNYEKEPEALIARTMKEFNEASKYPLFFSEDFERGMGETYGKYTHMPAEMSIGAANDTTLAYNFGKSTATEAKEMGFNWLLHPVCDLNMNPLQELVIERSISDSANLAIPLLRNQMHGIHDQNVIATVKHFPGDGVTMRNQHIVTTPNFLSKEEWINSFGKLFKEMIDGGAASIMVGHLTLPFFQTDSINGQLPPATCSPELMQGLLRDKLGYKGVIISDALNMGGCAGYYKDELELSVQVFAAGADVVLWPSLAYMDTVEARINRGEIPMSRLDEAVERIWALRERFGLLEKVSGDSIFTQMSDSDKALVAETGTKIAEKAVTLLEDKNNDIPLTTDKVKKILLAPVGYCIDDKKFDLTKKELEKRGFEVTMLVNPHFYEWGWQIDKLDAYDKIIVMFENRYFSPLGTALFKDKEAFGVWTVNMTNSAKRISISYSNPYLNELYESISPVQINAYSCDAFTQTAVVKALCGEIPFSGKSPVRLHREELR